MAKVLVVDDSLSVRKVVERALLARQMEVVCAATGSEALECIERDEPDVVVCDVVMPDKDGYEICEFVKGHPRLGRHAGAADVGHRQRRGARAGRAGEVGRRAQQAVRRRRPDAQARQRCSR